MKTIIHVVVQLKFRVIRPKIHHHLIQMIILDGKAEMVGVVDQEVIMAMAPNLILQFALIYSRENLKIVFLIPVAQ
ncbi:MAG: hypothetical protein DWP95_12070 [Proteobacteria bacterium]|nr:MAG: hypothetical protein DWP95_12070 [Pseudomonadota bacterium]